MCTVYVPVEIYKIFTYIQLYMYIYVHVYLS